MVSKQFGAKLAAPYSRRQNGGAKMYPSNKQIFSQALQFGGS